MPDSQGHPPNIIVMASSALDKSIPALPVRETKSYPPARIFNVKETKFEKYVATEPIGREIAASMEFGEAAIVIDNGPPPPFNTYLSNMNEAYMT